MDQHFLTSIDRRVQSLGLLNRFVNIVAVKLSLNGHAAADTCPPGGGYQCSKNCNAWGPSYCSSPDVRCHNHTCTVIYGAITGGGCVGSCQVVEGECWFDTTC